MASLKEQIAKQRLEAQGESLSKVAQVAGVDSSNVPPADEQSAGQADSQASNRPGQPAGSPNESSQQPESQPGKEGASGQGVQLTPEGVGSMARPNTLAPAVVKHDDASGAPKRIDSGTAEFKPANRMVPKDRKDVQGDSKPVFKAANAAQLASKAKPLQSPLLGETPAAADPRDLPKGITEQQRGFVAALDTIYSAFNEPELLSQTIRTIMAELQDNEQFIELISDQDIAMMIRGMRDTLGMARIAKASKSKKSKTPTKKAAEMAEMGSMLDDLLSDI